MRVITKSAKQTISLGKKIAKNFKGGEIIGLEGNLGAGKTTLVKGIAEELGIKQTITSPTFLLMKVYPVRKNKLIKNFVHLDCYRIKNPNDILGIGVEDYFNDPSSIVLIEWPEKIKKVLPGQTKKIELSLVSNNQREIILNI